MRFIYTPPPENIRDTHEIIATGSLREALERLGVPLRCYVYRTLKVDHVLTAIYAPKWVRPLAEEWEQVPDDWDSTILKRLIQVVHRTQDFDLAAAAVTILRLEGADAVRAFLDRFR